MAMVINTNIASLTAQRNLNASQSALQTSLQRLSSGLRINSAKDDAAGLAISERFTTQIRGLNQAMRNASDGISLSQTAEGALGELGNNLQRIRELAVQAANSTYHASDRAALDQEVQQRLAEINRIAGQTSFNGQKILDGTFGNAAFQVGANVGETISVDLDTSMRKADIGQIASATSTGLTTAIIEADANAVPATSGALGAFTAGGVNTSSTASYTYTLTLTDGTNTVNIADTVAASGTGTAATFATALSSAGFTADGAEQDGFVISYGGEANAEAALTAGTLSFSRADGVNFDVKEAFSGTGTPTTTTGFAGVHDTDGLTTTDGVEAKTKTSLTLTDFTIQVGDADAVKIAGTFSTVKALAEEINTKVSGLHATVSNGELSINSSGEALTFGGTQRTTVGVNAEYAVTGSLDTANVLTVTAANDAIQRIDSALTAVSELRSTFGAIQNRFESTISNLQGTNENLTAARSRIQDADFAAETATLTRGQILQQAGTAMLAQANSLPQGVLALLRG